MRFRDHTLSFRVYLCQFRPIYIATTCNAEAVAEEVDGGGNLSKQCSFRRGCPACYGIHLANDMPAAWDQAVLGSYTNGHNY